MFRSPKYFASFDCPYVKSGLCQRPYCPYNHNAAQQSEVRPSSSGTLSVEVHSALATSPAQQLARGSSAEDISEKRARAGSGGSASKTGDSRKEVAVSNLPSIPDSEHSAAPLRLGQKRHSEAVSKLETAEKVARCTSVPVRSRSSHLLTTDEDDVICLSSSPSSTKTCDSLTHENMDSDEFEFLQSSDDSFGGKLPVKLEAGSTATKANMPSQSGDFFKLKRKESEKETTKSSSKVASDTQVKAPHANGAIVFIEDLFAKSTAKTMSNSTAPKSNVSAKPADPEKPLQKPFEWKKRDDSKLTAQTRRPSYSDSASSDSDTPVTSKKETAIFKSTSRVEPPQKRFQDQMTAIRDGAQRVAEQQGKVRCAPRVATKAADAKAKSSSSGVKKKSNWLPPNLPLFVPKSYSGLPVTVRQPNLHTIFKALCEAHKSEPSSDQLTKLQKKAYEIEQDCASCNSKVAYNGRVARALLQIRREQESLSTSDDLESPGCSLSHADMLNGPKAQSCSFTYTRTEGAQRAVHRASNREAGEHDLCDFLQELLASEEQLVANGFPRADPAGQPQTAFLPVSERDAANAKRRLTEAELSRGVRLCVRCGERFSVDVEHNLYLTQSRPDACRYHSSKPFKRTRTGGNWEGLFDCCNGVQGSAGCKTHSYHVHDANRLDPAGYVDTATVDKAHKAAILAIDCEMVYTVTGYELARLSAVDGRLKVVADWFVRPTSRVLDYNEAFSGMRASFFDPSSDEYKGEFVKTFAEAQTQLLQLIGPDTVLVGHSLENDVIAMRIVHSKVVDTSLLFPHKLGPPFKRGLRTLAMEELREIVQDGVDGHDSVQDARTCMKLIVKKFRDEAGATFSFADV